VDKHARLASDQFPAVQKALAKEKADELVKPTAPAENNKDSEPKWMQIDKLEAKWVYASYWSNQKWNEQDVIHMEA